MAEVYVTLSEAAELEGVQYQTMARRTQRNKKNFVTKTEKSETGGRDVVLLHPAPPSFLHSSIS